MRHVQVPDATDRGKKQNALIQQTLIVIWGYLVSQGLQAQKFLFNVSVHSAEAIPAEFTSATVEWKVDFRTVENRSVWPVSTVEPRTMKQPQSLILCCYTLHQISTHMAPNRCRVPPNSPFNGLSRFEISQRGRKIVFTQAAIVQKGLAKFQQDLKMVCTLYKDPTTGAYEQKNTRFVMRQRLGKSKKKAPPQRERLICEFSF